MTLTVEEQIRDLGDFLRPQEKYIHEVARDGLCLLNSFKEGYAAIDVEVSLDRLKEVLRDGTIKNVEFYNNYSDSSVDLIQDLWLYLDEPEKYYSLASVDLFPDVLGKGMRTKVVVYNIDGTGKINETCVGMVEGYQHELFFAKYSVQHIDAVLCESTSKEVENLDLHNLTTQQLLNTIWSENSKYLVDKPLKGLRKNTMYTICGATLNDINCDDNGAYKNYTTTDKKYYVVKDDNETVTEAKSVFYDPVKKRYYYNERVGRNYKPKYISEKYVYTVNRHYRHNKSIPGLKHLTVRVKSEETKEFSDCICVVYTREVVKIEDEDDDDDDLKILPHKHSKNHDKPYIRTSQRTLEEEDLLLGSRHSSLDTYETVYEQSGGALNSTSQSDEPRDLMQIYRRKSKVNKENGNDGRPSTASSNDELVTLIEGQKSREIMHSIVTIKDKYFIVLLNERQMQDIVTFCTTQQNAAVLCIDTTFNLCDLWLTDTSYRNKRLINPKTQKHPVFLGPSFFHFTKDEATFMRFGIELMAAHKSMDGLKCIGVDLDSSIFNGLKIIFPNLESLVCVRHVDGRDGIKLDKLLATVSGSKAQKAKAKVEILKDIYGEKNESVQEIGLADAFNKDDFEVKLLSLEDKWKKLCPNFHSWFKRKRSNTFCSSIIQSARERTDVIGLFYNNDIEAMHFVEKLQQAFQKKSVLEVIDSLQRIISRQDELEMMAIYGGGSYVLAQPWKNMFGRDSAKWHSMSSDERQKHVAAMRNYALSCGDSFKKPKDCGRKPGHRTKTKSQTTPDIIIDRFADITPTVISEDGMQESSSQSSASVESKSSSIPSETIRFSDPRKKPPQVFEVHFRQKLYRTIQKCRGNCGRKIKPTDTGLLITTYGTSRWTNKSTGAEESRHGPLYIHCESDCLKRYDSETYYGPNDDFDYTKVTIDKDVQKQCNETEKRFLKMLGVRFL